MSLAASKRRAPSSKCTTTNHCAWPQRQPRLSSARGWLVSSIPSLTNKETTYEDR